MTGCADVGASVGWPLSARRNFQHRLDKAGPRAASRAKVRFVPALAAGEIAEVNITMRCSLKLSTIFVVALAPSVAGCSSSDESGPAGIDPKTKLPFCAARAAARTPDPCVDNKGGVLCKANSGYPGDELAMCPRDPEKAMVLHCGP